MRTFRTSGWVCLVVAMVCVATVGVVSAKTIEIHSGKSMTIGEALESAVAGDVILVGFGTYQEGRLWIPDGVSLVGAGASRESVVIESIAGWPLVQIMGAASGVLVSNLTLTLAEPANPHDNYRGEGAFIAHSTVTFMNVAFKGFEAGYGGAVYATDSQIYFDGCLFQDNTALATGGAISAVDNSAVSLIGCLMVNNTAASSGGTLNVALGSSAIVDACTIVGGGAIIGGGIASFDATSVSINRTIVYDGSGGASWLGDGSGLAVTCSDFYGNVGGDWTGILGAMLGADGNIAVDPLFCYALDGLNPYSLKNVSPCTEASSGCEGPIGAFGIGCTVLSNVPEKELPTVSRIDSAYPNPFNPRTSIKYGLHREGHVELAVFDISGRLVHRLVSETKAAGSYEALWEGRDGQGRSAAAGVYFFRLKTADTIDTKRVTLIK